MGRPKKEFKITTMKVPVCFKEEISTRAKKIGIDATDYLYLQLIGELKT
jgi:hypothetical protein